MKNEFHLELQRLDGVMYRMTHSYLHQMMTGFRQDDHIQPDYEAASKLSEVIREAVRSWDTKPEFLDRLWRDHHVVLWQEDPRPVYDQHAAYERLVNRVLPWAMPHYTKQLTNLHNRQKR